MLTFKERISQKTWKEKVKKQEWVRRKETEKQREGEL